MPAERFFVDAPFSEGERVAIIGAELHHLAHVMRVRVGDAVELVNGKGGLAEGRVLNIGKKEAAVEIEKCSEEKKNEERFVLTVPLMRPAKLEWVIEKGTELGASAFWLYQAEYSEKSDLSNHQLERLKYIAISAMKQCGRLDLPEIIVKKWDELFEGEVLYGDTRKNAPSIWKIDHVPQMVFISGPEKGFSKKELQVLEKKAKGVRLHKNILRAETAPIIAACVLIKS